MMHPWIDYYEILQVHHEAEPEVIQAAYKRLSRKYHPDVNQDVSAAQRMQRINAAYQCLSNTSKRRQYDIERQNRVRLENKPAKEQFESWNTSPASDPAYQVLAEYFQMLLEQSYASAYSKLSVGDRRQISLNDFTAWKEAVAGVYKLGSYEIRPFRRYHDCQIGEGIYTEIREYSVHVRDRNLKNRQITEDNLSKYVVFENGRWSVFLGYKALKPLILKFRCLAEADQDLNPDQVYAETVLKLDRLTGLKNRKGFLEDVEGEVQRNKRYGNPFTIAVLNILAGESDGAQDEYENLCMIHAARIVKRLIRGTDRVARWSSNGLAILFTETVLADAQSAVAKLHSRLHQGTEFQFESYAGVAEYRGNLRETLITAESDANLKTVSHDSKQVTAIIISDNPV